MNSPKKGEDGKIGVIRPEKRRTVKRRRGGKVTDGRTDEQISTEGERERERETERQTDRQTDRQRHRQSYIDFFLISLHGEI